MKQYSEAFVGFDTAKKKHAVAIADVGREGEIRYLGEIDSSPAAVERMIRKLAGRYEELSTIEGCRRVWWDIARWHFAPT
jgi:transposase